MSREKAVCRFVVIDRIAGARSSVWRVWAHHDGTDVYVAPSRIAGEFKLSIHRDGTNQLGLYGDVRNAIRAADKHYLKRWTRGDAPFVVDGWNTLCSITLDPREFESEPLPTDPKKPVLAINTPPDGQVVCVLVLATDAKRDSDLDGLPTLAAFKRGDEGEVRIVAVPADHNPALLAAIDADRHGLGWQSPARRGLDEPYGFTFGVGGFPQFAEYSTEKHDAPPLVPHLSGFRGTVRPWADAPAAYADSEVFCAVLACAPDGATLYVDPRSHCNHFHLTSDANDLITAYELGRIDAGWGSLADGRMCTAITMVATAEAAGITDHYPNPMKHP